MNANTLRRLNYLWKHRHTHAGEVSADNLQKQITIIQNAGPDTGGATHVVPYSKTGAAVVSVGAHKLVFRSPGTVLSVTAAVGTAPTGADLIVDVNKNGTTIFTTQANRPTIVDGNEISDPAVPDPLEDSGVLTLAPGDYLTVDVDQVGSSVPGADLTVTVEWEG
jgi:hypothetical protein